MFCGRRGPLRQVRQCLFEPQDSVREFAGLHRQYDKIMTQCFVSIFTARDVRLQIEAEECNGVVQIVTQSMHGRKTERRLHAVEHLES